VSILVSRRRFAKRRARGMVGYGSFEQFHPTVVDD
jgi:hypothetical protein